MRGAIRAAALALALCALAPLAVIAPAAPGEKRKLKVGTLEHFAEFCRRFIVLDNGRPFELEPFQRLLLRGFFAGVTELLVLLPKKNGKTTLLAAIALYHLIYTPDANCYIAASAKDQARILYEQACGFVERKDPKTNKLMPQAAALQKAVLLRKGYREIRSRRDGGFVRVVSGDKDTVDGVIVTLALVDELHRHKDGGQLYGVLADGVGPRDGQIITISTAGQRLKSVLGEIRKKAYLLGVKRLGEYGRCNHVRSPNGEFEMFEWALDEDDDREDLEIVKLANPLESNTVRRLRQRKESPTMKPSRWARFACGIWMQGEDAAVSALDWDHCARPGLKLKRRAGIFLGLDLGWKWDTTAVVPCEPYDREEFDQADEKGVKRRFWRHRRVRFGKPRFVIPPLNGQSTPHHVVMEAILAFQREDYEILGVVFDRNAEGEKIATDLERLHGIRVIEHSQAPGAMADACMGLVNAIGRADVTEEGTPDADGARYVEHPDDEEFNAHILAAQAKTVSGEKWRFEAPSENRGQRKAGKQDDADEMEWIDGAIAAAMVHRHATAPHEIEQKLDVANYRIERL